MPGIKPERLDAAQMDGSLTRRYLRNNTGADIAKGTLLSMGATERNGVYQTAVVAADTGAATGRELKPRFIADQLIKDGALGVVVEYMAVSSNTAALALEQPIYLVAAGGFSSVAGPNSIEVGFVSEVAVNGTVYLDPRGV